MLLFASVLCLVACSSTAASRPAASNPEASPVALVPAPIDRLPPAEAAALLDLAAESGPIGAPPTHDHETVTLVNALPPEEQARFDEQIRMAVDAAKEFITIEDVIGAGYAQSAAQAPGIGTHWVKWSLIDRPFDSAHPAMLLFDQSALHDTRLAGFSYWVRSDTAPEGFVGPNDVWHRHSGLCFENGWLMRENVPSAAECAGQWLNGGDLWMLHAWVAPGVPNRAGLFAARNNDLCPPYWQQLPDVSKCGAGSSGHGTDTVVVPAGGVYCHLPET